MLESMQGASPFKKGAGCSILKKYCLTGEHAMQLHFCMKNVRFLNV